MLPNDSALFRRLKFAKDSVRKAVDVTRRRLRVVAILVTDRCNSRCRHCFIWNKKENNDLSLDVIREILDDPVVKGDTYFELTGGEFLDHPQYRDILALFAERKRDYMMLSNGMYPQQLIDAVRDFKVPHLYMSLDGLGETYKKVRGVDCADDILAIIDELKDETEIFVGYTITPWNAVEDLVAVKQAVEERGAGFGIGAYLTPEFFDTVRPAGTISPEHEPYLNEFMHLHNPWIEKKLKIPCWNIRTKVYIMGSGDVHLCQQKSLVLGNLHERSLGEIWNAAATIDVHDRHQQCNDCWLACNRPLDAELAYAARSLLPAGALNRLFGESTWNMVRDAYRRR